MATAGPDDTTIRLLTVEQAVQGGGLQGPPGPPGPGASYVYTQVTPAATWIITHNLNSLVGVTLYDQFGALVDSDVAVTSQNVITVTFSGPQAGSAIIVS